MANINVVVGSYIGDGYKVKFRTPCDSTTIEGLEVKYPAKNGIGTLIKKFIFKDAHGTELSGVGNLFVRGVMIEVLLDVTHGVAYIQNADTNSYVESFKSEIERLEESQKEFLTVAGKAVERCEAIADSADGFEQAMNDATERAESVKGVYTGDGEMPEGYYLQIDPNGEVFELDAELNADSKNPVENRVIAAKFANIDSGISNINDSVGTLRTSVGSLFESRDDHAFRIGTLETESRQLSDHSIDHEGRILTLENAKAAEPEKCKMLYEAEWSDYLYGVTIPGISKYVLLSGVVTVYDGASTTVKGIYPVLFFRSPSSSAYVTYGSTFNDGGQSFELKVDLATENVKTNIAGSVKVSCLTGIY